MAMARKIHSARNWSRRPRDSKAESLGVGEGRSAFSGSRGGESGVLLLFEGERMDVVGGSVVFMVLRAWEMESSVEGLDGWVGSLCRQSR